MDVQHYQSFSFKWEREEKKENEMIWNCPGEPTRTGFISFIPNNNRGSLFHLRDTQSSRSGVSHCMTLRNQSKPGVIRMTDARVVCSWQGFHFFFYSLTYLFIQLGFFFFFGSGPQKCPQGAAALDQDTFRQICFHHISHPWTLVRPAFLWLPLLSSWNAAWHVSRCSSVHCRRGRERGRESERWPKLMWQTGLPSCIPPSLPPHLRPSLPPLLKDNKEGQRIEDVKGRMSERQEAAWILTSPSKMFSDRGV